MTPPLSSALDGGSRCSSALVLLFVVGQPGSWFKDRGGGDELLVPFFPPSLSPHRSLSASHWAQLVSAGWVNSLIEVLVAVNKRLHLSIGHMAGGWGLWSFHRRFGCICTSYRASTLRLIYHQQQQEQSQSWVHWWIPKRINTPHMHGLKATGDTHRQTNTLMHTVNLYFPCFCLIVPRGQCSLLWQRASPSHLH